MKDRLRLFVSAVAVFGLVLGTVALLRQFAAAISASGPEVSAAVIGAMATVFVGLAAVLMSQRHERKQTADEAHRLRKVEIYGRFIETIASIIGASNENLDIQAPSGKELVTYLFKFKSDILLWGSPEVIKAQIAFEEAPAGAPKIQAVNRLYLAIREDLGLSNFGLDRRELVKLHVNDRAELDKLLNSSQ